MTVSFMSPPAEPNFMDSHVDTGLQRITPDIKSTLMPTEFQDFDDIDILLAEECAGFFDDPLGWVMWAFDWGHGDLEGFDGPDEWQRRELVDLGNDIKGNRFNGVDPVDPVRTAIASGHGIGKILSNIIDLDTPDGIKSWGDIEVGDRVFGSNGEPTNVTAKYPSKEHDFYKITFSDGSTTYAGLEHQWNITTRSDRDKGRPSHTVTTEDMLGNLNRKYQIPMCDAVSYPEMQHIIHPYLMGYILGNGSVCTPSAVKVSCHDDLYDYMETLLPEGFGFYGEDKYRHISRGEHTGGKVNVISEELKRLGLYGAKSMGKFVPDEYKYDSPENRLHLIRGLMDSDGTCSLRKRGGYRVQFSTSSPHLRDDMMWLVKSIGGLANYSTDSRRGGNVNSTCDNYEVHTNFPNDINPFFLVRKRDSYQEFVESGRKRRPSRTVVSIQYDHTGEGHCITVDAENHLYCANDFIVTHNSALTSWLILFIMSTRPYAKGIVTANTGEQLRTKTWSELGKWRTRCIIGHWFEYNNGKGSMSLYHKSFASSWRVDAQTCREENSEAFAGLHAANSTPFYLFDEASAVPSKIWEVAEGGLTDGEPMFFCFGNPTRNDGKFHDCFNTGSRWRTKQIDSRNAKMTNKRLIEQWKVDHGEDSDFFRVRVKGQFPKAGDMQFMPSDIVEHAQTEPLGAYLGDEPLIMSFDVARGGGDDCRIAFRRGDDAQSEMSYRITHENSRDSMKMLSKVVMVIERHKPNAIFVDETGVGGPILDRLRELGYNAYGVQFGSKADDESRYYNKTAEMGDRLRNWMMKRGRIPNDEQLKRELVCREFWHDDKGRLVLERKQDIKTRLGYSPDWADAMYLLFAMENVPRLPYKRGDLDVAPWARENAANRRNDYDPLEHAEDSV